jgi:hypothetical protein
VNEHPATLPAGEQADRLYIFAATPTRLSGSRPVLASAAPTSWQEGQGENVKRLKGFGFAHFAKLDVGDEDERVMRNGACCHAIEDGIVRLEYGRHDDTFTARIEVQSHDATSSLPSGGAIKGSTRPWRSTVRILFFTLPR